MKGRIHFSKHGRVHVVGEDNRVYYTGLSVIEINILNRALIEFDVENDAASRVGNLRELKSHKNKDTSII